MLFRSTSYMVKAILEAAGKKVGLIGTNGAVIGTEKYATANTTPESYLVQEYFAKMVEERKSKNNGSIEQKSNEQKTAHV